MAGNGLFKTRDLYLAAYLECNGYGIKTERDVQDSSKVIFVMTDIETRKEDVRKFFNKTAQVSARLYSESLRTLKGMIANC